jgi:DNA-binding PadR family transcriptional regulator
VSSVSQAAADKSRHLLYSHDVTKSAPPVTLAAFELLVMVAALRLGGDEAHAVSIAADIAARTSRIVRRANVYMTLQRLEEKGLLTTALGEPRPERGGKPRRLVTPTRDGVAAVRATMTAIHAMTRGVKI